MYIHRWAAIASQIGIDSAVFQTTPFSVWWDGDYLTPHMIESIGQGDTVIIPETMWDEYAPKFDNKIMLLQNWLWMSKHEYPGVSTIVCSRYLANYVMREHPEMVLRGIVRPYLSEGLFSGPEGNERDTSRVLVMSRRSNLGPKIKEQLERHEFSVEYIDHAISQYILSLAFKQCEYYVHTVSPEGWPQICLEAMRSKTLVVGTSGGGGNEFMFDGENCVVTQDTTHANITDDEFISQVIEGIVALRSNPNKEEMRDKAYQWSLRYTLDATAEELKRVLVC